MFPVAKCERPRLFKVTVLVMVMVLAPFSYILFSANHASAEEPTVFILGTTTAIEEFNPFQMVLRESRMVLHLAYESLVSVDSEMMPTPLLASGWSCDESGLVWTFIICDDVYWHDAEKVSAYDVEFTYNLILDNPSQCALYTDLLSDVTDVTALQNDTLQITTSVPKADIPFANIPVLPEHLWCDVPSSYLSSVDPFDPSYFPDGPVGSGPFVLEQYVHDDYVLMESWPAYHYGSPKFDQLMIKMFYSVDGMTNALLLGQIDLTYDLDVDLWDYLSGSPNIGRQMIKSGIISELGINCASAEVRANFPSASDNLETTNRSVRQAIAMCVNQSYLVSECWGGIAAPADTLLAEVQSYWHRDIPSEDEFPYDLSAAAALLDAAGYVDINGDSIRENTTSGVSLDFSIIARSNYATDVAAANLISSNLGSIGISAPVFTMSEAQLYTYWFGCRYDLYIWGWWTMFYETFSPSFMLSVMTTEEILDSPVDFTAWSDSFYSNAYYDQLYEDQLSEINMSERQSIVHEMQDVLYYDSPYVMLWYEYELVAYNENTFTNYPDMFENPNMSPEFLWFYLEITPAEYSGPTDVYAGEDIVVDGGVPIVFTGYATDPDDPVDSLTWTWFFDGPDGEYYKYGRSVITTFYYEGTVHVTLTVTDPDLNVGTDSLVVTVLPGVEGQRVVSYHWYDMFDVPFGEWWYIRQDLYGTSGSMTDSYPYIYSEYFDGPSGLEEWIYTNARLNITGWNLPEINMMDNPEFLPMLGTSTGGNATIDWYMQYATEEDASRYSSEAASWMDGWIVILNGTAVLDEDASATVLGTTHESFVDFGTWWEANNATVSTDYMNWLIDEAGRYRLDIFPMYGYPFTPLDYTIWAEKAGDSVVIHYDIFSWGMEALMTRWLHEAFMPSEWYFEDMDFHATIGSGSTDISVDTAVEAAMYAFGSTPGGDPCWVWESVYQDYIESSAMHPYSAYDLYAYEERLCLTPGSQYYGSYVPYHNTPGAFNLSVGEMLTFEWPSGDQLFLQHVDTDVLNGIYSPMTCTYSEPDSTDLDGNVVLDAEARTLSFVGPIDMWEWSNTQTSHEYLVDEWERVGLLPYGAPFIRFTMPSEEPDLPPVANISAYPLVGNVSTSFEFDASGCTDDIDDVSSLEVRWDWEDDGMWDTDWSTTKIVHHVFDSLGIFTVRLQVRDSSGLLDDTAVDVTVIDNQAPLTTVSCDGPLGLNGWYNGSVEISLTASDDHDPEPTILYSLDGLSWYVYDSPFTLDDDGVSSIEYYAYDCYGNNESTESLEICIDSSSPETDIELSGTLGSHDWYRSSVEVTLSSYDGVSGVDVICFVVDDEPFNEYSSPFMVEGDGTHTVEFWSVDVAGNQELHEEITFGIDAEAPHTEFIANGTHGNNGWYTSNVTISLSAVDGASELDKICVRVNEGAWAEWESDMVFGDGVYSIEYYSVDLSGNSESVSEVTLKVDTQHPVILFISESGFKSTSKEVTIYWHYDDNLNEICTVSCSLDGVSIDGASSDGISLTGLSDGTYELTVLVCDEANNTQTSSMSFSVNTSILSMDGPAGPWAVLGIIAAIVAVVGVAGYLVMRKMKTS